MSPASNANGVARFPGGFRSNVAQGTAQPHLLGAYPASQHPSLEVVMTQQLRADHARRRELRTHRRTNDASSARTAGSTPLVRLVQGPWRLRSPALAQHARNGECPYPWNAVSCTT